MLHHWVGLNPRVLLAVARVPVKMALLLAAVGCLLVFWLQGCSAATSGYHYRPLGSISITNPSFVRVLQCGSAPSPSLWITEFSGELLKPGKVYTIANVSSFYPDFSAAKPTLVSSNFKWPNLISVAPKEIGDFIVVPDGFLVPGKSTGGIYLLNCNLQEESSTPIELTSPKLGWFHHMVVWRDMNGDGRLDVLTARATKPIIGHAGGELLWLEQPAENPLTSVPWKEHVIASGPDVIIIVADLNKNDNQFEVFACEFFSERLSVLTISTTNATVTGTRDIDTTIGPAYDAILTDLNMDGSEDLLVTNHKGGNGGEVYAYEIPKDVLNGNYTKHLVANNFTVTESGSNQAAPGFVYTFKPNSNYTGKPFILIAGDGSQKAYVLQPTDKDFVYNKTVLLSVNGVVGSIGLANLVGPDEWAEFFVPDYDENRLYAFAIGT